MKNKYIFVLVMLLGILILCSGLTTVYVKNNPNVKSESDITVVTSFYPMYIATLNIIDGVDGVRLENLSEPQTGCLHDFQLTPEDMKLLSGADVFVINGGGIEGFMSEVAEAYPELSIVEACEGIELLEADEHEDEDEHEHEDGHEHENEHHHHEEGNAHAWMSVSAYRKQVDTIARRLMAIDPVHATLYENNLAEYDRKLQELEAKQQEINIKGENVIIFHEAYEYVVEDYGLNSVFLMDLDEERQVSAGEVAEVVSHIKEDNVRFILAEELYGKSMGDTVTKEADVTVLYIDPLNRGAYDKDSYINGMLNNINILREAFSRKE